MNNCIAEDNRCQNINITGTGKHFSSASIFFILLSTLTPEYFRHRRWIYTLYETQDSQMELQSFLDEFQRNLNSFADILLNDFYFAISEMQQLRNQLQQVREEELELKNNLTSVMTDFEDKAGRGMALDGLLKNNTSLKHEIMQKRSRVDRKCLSLMEKTNSLFQKVDQISAMLQEQSERHSKNTTVIEAEIEKFSRQLNNGNQHTLPEQEWPVLAENPNLNQPLENLMLQTMKTLEQMQQSLELSEKNT